MYSILLHKFLLTSGSCYLLETDKDSSWLQYFTPINNCSTSSYVQVFRLKMQDSHRLFIHRNQLETPKQTFPGKLHCPVLKLRFKTFNQSECGDFNQWECKLTSQWERYRGIKTTNELDCICLNTWAISWIERGNYYILLVANVTKNKFFSIDTNYLTLITF